MHVRDLQQPRPTKGRPPAFALPLRLFLGVTFVYAGVQKLLDPNFFDASAAGSISQQLHGYVRTGSPLSPIITHVALPHAAVIGGLVAIAEIWIGLSTLAGLLARIGTVVGLLLSSTFFLTASWTVRPYFLGPDLPYMIAWLTLLLTGPGPFNADAYLFSFVRARPMAGDRRDRRRQQRAESTWPKAAREDAAATVMTRSVLIRGFGASIILAAFSAAIAALIGHRPAKGAAPSANILTGAGGTSADALARTTSTSNASNVKAGASSPAGVAPTSASIGNVAQSVKSSSAGQTAAKPASTAVRGGKQAQPAPTAASLPAGATLLGNSAAVPLNQAGLYTDPVSGDPGILVHLPDDRFVAFDAICPHAGCTVEYDPSRHQLVCPCHGARFDPAKNAQVLAGPARQPLDPLTVKILANGDVYAVTA